MKVLIAEKPSVARDIAAIVGANNRKDGYLEGNGYAVTWAFGHLIGLAMPQDYGITGFQAENLPILPSEFKLLPRQVKDGKEYKPDPGVMKQLKVIRELFNKCDLIINCCDAGREGCLIFRYIYNYLECTKPFDRLWISSLTDQAIRKGLENLRPGKGYDNLYASAKARSQADWVIGINASNALSISAGHGVWSLGRVQTPTLSMICSRYLENKDFRPQTYFQVKLHTAKDAMQFAIISTERFGSKQEADEILNRVRSAESVNVISSERKEANQEPPLLYDLTALQKEANSRHGFSADKTLSVAQSLYEAKLISYPRTGSRYISDDVFAEIPALIGQLSGYAPFGSYAKTLSGTSLNRRSVNDKKVTDHHALIITENMPKDISADQRIIYDMIVARVLEAFSEKCTKENTTVSLDASGVAFSVKGSVILIPGWRAVLNASDEEKGDDEAPALPSLSNSDILPINGTDLLEKQTKPRPLHTESSLLSSMETCGKELTDEAEREAIKESGIGTPATRAAIIETLFSREYIVREKKSLVPTNKGLVVYLAVKDKKIADISMTGEWENALSKIEKGEMDADTFHRGIEVYAAQITTELLGAKIEGGGNQRESCPCPKCKSSQVVFYQKVAKCQDEDCGLIMFRNKSGKDLTDGQMKELLTKGKTGIIKGFKSKAGKQFDASLEMDDVFNIKYKFSEKKKRN
ncbi:DNA topoisomerase-3 [Dysgonomonas sp. PFB1-18]|uniref:type IA DNA topoisomerase n=1 Tax=unclassified Dysgonomonas TaxID=2630389 RepID=UPI0013CF5F4B|nr:MULTISPECIES: type IA DNA topoisomerase [unclassified Dysgonomonas]MDH6310060.1 DNA topoisomerase-3 [Dysgonomonas sp. PF1-14]MDH6339969.1 DNA topoisomerase-3 [Dysgonomonas sp. PF1-16]MDH6381617.1 DNA topoisomerase-3 [Dysgonomonas sp. PFB1-18]MDH6398746.1 DNA topoisomerase-3 [Dysgonomonas sp. PF1-23]NDV93592.1 type IA DNA topoisomerase [Dysgonomonas sp. 521]